MPQHLLIASEPLGPGMDAERTARAIARGVGAAGTPQPDLCSIDAGARRFASARTNARPGHDVRPPSDVGKLLDELDFDARMRASRAVVIACERLCERALLGSLMFEIATRARQGGVPAYAVTAEDALDAFDARILDLQLVIEARTGTALAAAGRRLAQIA